MPSQRVLNIDDFMKEKIKSEWRLFLDNIETELVVQFYPDIPDFRKDEIMQTLDQLGRFRANIKLMLAIFRTENFADKLLQVFEDNRICDKLANRLQASLREFHSQHSLTVPIQEERLPTPSAPSLSQAQSGCSSQQLLPSLNEKTSSCNDNENTGQQENRKEILNYLMQVQEPVDLRFFPLEGAVGGATTEHLQIVNLDVSGKNKGENLSDAEKSPAPTQENNFDRNGRHKAYSNKNIPVHVEQRDISILSVTENATSEFSSDFVLNSEEMEALYPSSLMDRREKHTQIENLKLHRTSSEESSPSPTVEKEIDCTEVKVIASSRPDEKLPSETFAKEVDSQQSSEQKHLSTTPCSGNSIEKAQHCNPEEEFISVHKNRVQQCGTYLKGSHDAEHSSSSTFVKHSNPSEEDQLIPHFSQLIEHDSCSSFGQELRQDESQTKGFDEAEQEEHYTDEGQNKLQHFEKGMNDPQHSDERRDQFRQSDKEANELQHADKGIDELLHPEKKVDELQHTDKEGDELQHAEKGINGLQHAVEENELQHAEKEESELQHAAKRNELQHVEKGNELQHAVEEIELQHTDEERNDVQNADDEKDELQCPDKEVDEFQYPDKEVHVDELQHASKAIDESQHADKRNESHHADEEIDELQHADEETNDLQNADEKRNELQCAEGTDGLQLADMSEDEQQSIEENTFSLQPSRWYKYNVLSTLHFFLPEFFQ